MAKHAARAQQGNRKILAILIAIVAIALVAAVAFVVVGSARDHGANVKESFSEQAQASDRVVTEVEADDPAAIAARIRELQAQNPDAYAWLLVPDTKVDVPILQNQFVDNYYLVHDAYGNESGIGAAYTQVANTTSFHDPVTLVYGHTFEANDQLSDEMFGTLHYFEDPAFFDAHPNFFIFTTDEKLTYEIVSAYEYDDRHIMNSFDFDDPAVLQEYFDSVAHPDSMVSLVRANEQLAVGQDAIVVLSTCTRPANDAARYLVAGKLVDIQPIAA